MKISQKLSILAISAVVLLVLVGATGLYVANNLEDTLDTVNTNGIQGVRSLNQLKIHQLAMGLSLYRHIVSNKPEQKASYEKAIQDAQHSFDKSMTAYEASSLSARGKELA